METKRCSHCHKVQKATAQTCSRCGEAFAEKRRTIPTRRSFTRPSLPAASPHRAGHYSGLHPEDQPYFSSEIQVQRPPLDEDELRPWPQQEPEHIVLPSTQSAPALKVYRETLHAARREQTTRRKNTALAALKRRLTFPITPVFARRRSLLSSRAISTILAIACLLFLLASSIIAFVQISSPTLAHASLKASPDVLRAQDEFTLSGAGFGHHDALAFTYDTNKELLSESGKSLQVSTDSLGTFSIQERVPTSWQVGPHTIYVVDQRQQRRSSTTITVQPPSQNPPRLQLSLTSIAFPAAAPGTVSSQNVTLTNAGGGQLQWQASTDQTWLSVTPPSGTFAGSTSISITVNRGNLTAQSYLGHVTVTQVGANTSPVVLAVTMGVDSTPSRLALSTTSLFYSAIATQSPAAQTIVIQNSGGRPLHWSSTITTGDGSSWLSLFPGSGSLPAQTSAILTVSVHPQQLPVGTYTGWISFGGDAHAQVRVTLTLLVPGNLLVSPSTCTLNTSVDQTPTSQVISLQNSGDLALDWTAAVSTQNQGQWLSVTPTHGSLAPGAQVNVTVTADVSALQAGSYQGTVTFTADNKTTQFPVALTVVSSATPTPLPTAAPTPTATPTPTVIPTPTTTPTPIVAPTPTLAPSPTPTPSAQPTGIQPTPLTVSTLASADPNVQNVQLTNMGTSTLTWQATVASAAAAFTVITPTDGTLAPGESATIAVSIDPSSVPSNISTTTLTITSTYGGSSPTSQNIVLPLPAQNQ